MKIIKSTPTNKQFLDKYGKLLKISIAISIFCQLVSSTTETGVFYSNFHGKFEFLGSWGIIPTLILTFGFVAGLELGGRALLAYSTDSILYKRFSGLELFLTVLIFGFTILLLCTSGNVSLKGSPSVVKTFKTPPDLDNTILIDSILQGEKLQILKQYSNDSLLITENYNKQITSIKNECSGKIEKLQMSIDNYIRKEERTGKSFTSKKNYLKGKIAGLKAEKENQIGAVEIKKGNELTTLLQERKNNVAEAKETHQSEKTKIETSNDKATNEFEAAIKTDTGGLKFLVVACIFLFVICVVTERVIYKGAGIEVRYEFDDYFFRQSVLAAWWNFINEKWQQKAHTQIYSWHSKIPEVAIQERPIIIFNRSENSQFVDVTNEEQERLNLIALNSNVNFDENQYQLLSEYVAASSVKEHQAMEISNLEKKALELMEKAKAERSAGNEAKAKEMELKANHVIKAFFETDFTPKYSKKLGRKFRTKLEGYLDGLNSNPFDEYLPKKRRPMGFQFGSSKNENSYGRTELQGDNHYHFHGDKFTVPHLQDNGKTKQVNMSEILSKINLYSGRVSESFKKLQQSKKSMNKKGIKTHTNALENREKKLAYWNEKKKELSNQIKK